MPVTRLRSLNPSNRVLMTTHRLNDLLGSVCYWRWCFGNNMVHRLKVKTYLCVTMKLSSCSSHRWSSSICCCCIISLSSIIAWPTHPLSCRKHRQYFCFLFSFLFAFSQFQNSLYSLDCVQVHVFNVYVPPCLGSTVQCVQVCVDSRNQSEGSCLLLLPRHRELKAGGEREADKPQREYKIWFIIA